MDIVCTASRLRDFGWRATRSSKALAIDPEYAPALARLAVIANWYEQDLVAAATHIEHALALEPANPDILVLGRRVSSAARVGLIRRSRSRVPAQPRPDQPSEATNLATAYYYAGRLDEAIATYRSDLQAIPDSPLAITR